MRRRREAAPAARDGTIILTSGQLTVSDRLTIDGPGQDRLAVSGNHADRVFRVSGIATDLTLSDLTITGGSATLANGNPNGGGILVEHPGSQLALNSVQVVGNSAVGGNGGGIYTPGRVTLDDSAVGTTTAPNFATFQGGGIWAGGGVTLDASTVEGNGARDGGGIVVEVGEVSLTRRSAVSHNAADPTVGMAGGIFVALGSVSFSDASRVEDNHAWRTGGILLGVGDVVVDGGSALDGNVGSDTTFGNGGILDIRGNVTVSGRGRITNNVSGGMGSGAIVVVFGDVTVGGQSRITGNTGIGPGGGIAANFHGQVTVTHSRVNRNTGGAIGGGIVNFSGPLGGVTVTRSQVNDNTLIYPMSLQDAVNNLLALFEQIDSGEFQDLATAVGGEGGGRA